MNLVMWNTLLEHGTRPVVERAPIASATPTVKQVQEMLTPADQVQLSSAALRAADLRGRAAPDAAAEQPSAATGPYQNAPTFPTVQGTASSVGTGTPNYYNPLTGEFGYDNGQSSGKAAEPTPTDGSFGPYQNAPSFPTAQGTASSTGTGTPNYYNPLTGQYGYDQQTDNNSVTTPYGSFAKPPGTGGEMSGDLPNWTISLSYLFSLANAYHTAQQQGASYPPGVDPLATQNAVITQLRARGEWSAAAQQQYAAVLQGGSEEIVG